MSEHTAWVPEREPDIVFADLLEANWNYTGDGRFDTNWIHTGWYSEQNPNPQITLTKGGETPRGERGWSSIDPSGAGPTTHVDGTVLLNVWVPHDTAPYDVTGIHPGALVDGLRREAERIISDLYEGTTYNGAAEFQYVAPGGFTVVPTREESPVDNRHEFPIFYTWHKNRVVDDS